MKRMSKSLGVAILLFICFSMNAQESMPTFFNQTDSTNLYHTLLDAYSFHFSGIMAIKKINEQHRIIFSTETGATLFDFTVEGNRCKANFVMKEMKNPIFVNLVKKDLVDLIKPKVASKNIEIQKNQLESIQDNNAHITYQPIEYVVNFKNKNKVNKTIRYILYDSKNQHAETIKINHLNMPIQIEMNLFYNAE